MDKYALTSYQFDLPHELIAKYPVHPRDSSRLMIVDRSSYEIKEIKFREISTILHAGDSLIFNDTKVIPARLFGKKAKTGGMFEILLSKPLGNDIWEIVAKPGRRLHKGTIINFSQNFSCQIEDKFPDGRLTARLLYEGDLESLLKKHGEMPLPHYLGRKYDPKIDIESYQTIYANKIGAVAAPTAGLHFTQELLQSLKEKGIEQHFLTLHVGIGTFQPIKVNDIREHKMHKETCYIDQGTAAKLNAKTGRKVCVGTTTCRTLEASLNSEGSVQSGSFENSIFIYPDYKFKYVEALLTNFHLPGSSLLLLVSAFAGYDLIREAYAKAIKDKFRFFSYGDAMLIL